MSEKIPIKVKKKHNLDKQLREQVQAELKERFNSEGSKLKKDKRFLLLALVVLIGIAISIVWFFLSFQKPLFDDLAPAQAVVFAVVNQKTLYEQTAPFHGFLKDNNPYIYSALAKIDNYLEEADIDFKENIQPFFEEKAGFVLMPANIDTSVPFVLLFKKKFSFDKNLFNQSFFKFEQVLKKDYSLSFSDYRQVKLSIFDFLKVARPEAVEIYVYVEIEDYVLISNSQEAIKSIIDLIVDK